MHSGYLRSRKPLLALAFILCLSYSLPARAGSRCSFLIHNLLKEFIFEDQPDALSDLDETLPTIGDTLKPIREDAPDSERIALLQNFPIAQVTAAPGHRYLRKPQQVAGLVAYIQETHGGNFSPDPLLLNVVTDFNGQVRSVDLWNAHHRLVSFLQAGFKFLGDISPENFVVLVNGRTSSGALWEHFVPAAGIDLDQIHDYREVPPGSDIRPGTIAVSGKLSNFDLGSRNTVGQLFRNTKREKPPQIGVYFGTFDPIHEGHVAVIKGVLREYGLDEVIVIPNLHSIEKPNAIAPQARIDMLATRIRKEGKMNLYIGDSSPIVDRFGRDALVERISQIYGTRRIFQIIGEDSYDKLLAQGAIHRDSDRTYIVMRRPSEASGELVVPEALKHIVKISNYEDHLALSSSKIRMAIGLGQTPPPETLDPDVLEYIRQHHLYQ